MRKHAKLNSDAGFTLVELLTVILLAGILALIAAPGWLTFVNNRRADTARDQILQLLRQAQIKATRTHQIQVVNFITPTNDQPIVETGGISQKIDAQTGGTGGFNSNMFRLDISANAKTGCSANATGCIVFDNRGNIVADDNSLGNGFVIAVSSPASSTNTSNRRCVIVTSLLGSMQSGSGDQQCPLQ
jgi:prepilin-type N-terminal cleavage/methylation domain-containing protein